MISPQRREWAEMRNDPSGFVPRKCEYDAHKKTRHAGDCVATQTGHDKGWDGARPPLATDFRAQSSLCSLSDRLLSARVSPRVCLAKKKSATDGCRSTAPARLVGPGRRVLGANHPEPGLGPHRRRRRRHSLRKVSARAGCSLGFPWCTFFYASGGGRASPRPQGSGIGERPQWSRSPSRRR